MERVLHIYDVSPFVHAGHVNKYSVLEDYKNIGGHWVVYETPTGGTALIIKSILSNLLTDDFVFCCDRNPTIKKSMSSTYKSNRNHATAIEVEKKAAEYILEDCGLTVLYRDGYEADDIIYSLIQKYHDSYDKIYIYTADSDLYFLVDDIVSIKPSSTRAKSVTKENYAYTVKSKEYIPYNTMIPYKMLKGDSSDCIEGMPKHLRDRFIELISAEALQPHLGDKEYLYYYVQTCFPEALHVLDMIFPLDVDNLPDDFNRVNRQKLLNWADAINVRGYSGMTSIDFDIDYHIQQMQNKGIYLERG